MSKSATPESNGSHESREASGKRGAGDEEKENEEGILETSSAANSTTSTTVSTIPATADQFMHTPEFRRHFVDFVHVETLLVLRLATKGWNTAADAKIDEGVKSVELMVHGGNDISYEVSDARVGRRELVTRVISLLNITKIGQNAFVLAVNLVVVDIPQGIESIDDCAFDQCTSLTTVYFPITLRSIGFQAFHWCESLDNVELLHTKLQELGFQAFFMCEELKSMAILDSLQTFGSVVFHECSKLVPFSIDVRWHDDDGAEPPDTTSEVVAYLHSKQLKKLADKIKQEENEVRARRAQQRHERRETH